MKALEIKKLLEPIPKEDFITGSTTDEVGKCCATGHLRRLLSGNPNMYNFTNLVGWTINEKIAKEIQFKDILVTVNDGLILKYNQDNPKDRVMAYLDDLIKEGK